MNVFTRIALNKYVNPKSIIFGLAVFNFVLFWYTANTMPGACVACPWFYPWSYFNEPSLLLFGAVFLMFSRKLCYVVALSVSGYLIGDLIYRVWTYPLNLADLFFFSPYDEIVYAWQIQYLLALTLFVIATLNLAQALRIPRRIEQTLGADSP
jgi:hypothetical protein